MSDTEKLGQMVTQLAAELKEAQEARAKEALAFQKELKEAREAQTAEVNRLVTALGGIANVPPQGDPAIRIKNVLSMRKDLRKSQRVKAFNEKDFDGSKF